MKKLFSIGSIIVSLAASGCQLVDNPSSSSKDSYNCKILSNELLCDLPGACPYDDPKSIPDSLWFYQIVLGNDMDIRIDSASHETLKVGSQYAPCKDNK